MADKQITRRRFMGDSLVGAAGIAVGLNAVKGGAAQDKAEVDTKKILNYNPDMEYRRLGKTGLWVSAVAMGGCANNDVTDVDIWAGSTQSDAESYNTVDFWKCPGQTFGWYVEWDADDCDGFEGEISLVGITPEVDTFTADEEDIDAAGTATLPSSMSGGIYTVRCWMRSLSGDWEYGDAAAKIKVVEVELEFVGRGDPTCTLLSAEKLCTNAQPCYKKNKWKAAKVRPSGTTASVSSTGVGGVTFSGEGGSSPSALSEGQEFWVHETGTTGNYQITLTHNDYGNCPDTDGDNVFKFKFNWTKTNSDGNICFDGYLNKDTGTVSAPKGSLPLINPSGAEVYWYYDMKVVTEPGGQYSGNVEGEAQVELQTDGMVTIYCCPRPWISPLTLSLCATCGPVTVCASAQSGANPYPNCLAGWDSGIKIGTNPEGQCGDVELGVWDVPPLVVIHQIKAWEPDPDITHIKPDILRTWDVNVTEIEFWVRVGVVSRIEELCGITTCPGSWVGQNTQQISSVEVKEHDGTFEVVP